MQPTVLNGIEHFNNMMAMRVFVEACEQWNVENKNYRYQVYIEEMYFDIGQDWKYTGFLTVDTDKADDDMLGSWQSFCPRDWELIVECMDINKLIAMAWYYMDNLNSKDSRADIRLYTKFE
jgi:hypothetical protein